MEYKMDNALQERMKLVKEVEKYPCLYKKDSVDYYHENITDKAWADVGRVVGWPGPKCKEKFSNIHAIVGRYIKRHSKSGLGIRRPYYLMDAMRYAFPHIKSFPKSSDEKSEVLVQSENSSNNLLFEDDDDVFEVTVGANDLTKSPEFCGDFSNEDSSPVSSPVPESKTIDPLHQLDQSEQRSEVDPSASTDKTTALENDTKKMFLLSLLPDIYAMDAKQTRKFKRGVLQLIGDILDDS